MTKVFDFQVTLNSEFGFVDFHSYLPDCQYGPQMTYQKVSGVNNLEYDCINVIIVFISPIKMRGKSFLMTMDKFCKRVSQNSNSGCWAIYTMHGVVKIMR